jgi:hypothetical protein
MFAKPLIFVDIAQCYLIIINRRFKREITEQSLAAEVIATSPEYWLEGMGRNRLSRALSEELRRDSARNSSFLLRVRLAT